MVVHTISGSMLVFFSNIFKLHVSTNVAVRLGSSNVRQTDIVNYCAFSFVLGMYNKAHVFSLMYLFSLFPLYMHMHTQNYIYIHTHMPMYAHRHI
jgi:hypothetical protein